MVYGFGDVVNVALVRSQSEPEAARTTDCAENDRMQFDVLLVGETDTLSTEIRVNRSESGQVMFSKCERVTMGGWNEGDHLQVGLGIRNSGAVCQNNVLVDSLH